MKFFQRLFLRFGNKSNNVERDPLTIQPTLTSPSYLHSSTDFSSETSVSVDSLPFTPSNIDDLPVELLADIFRHVIFDHTLDSSKHIKSRNGSPLRDILLTCKRWHDIAMADPVLWTFIYIGPHDLQNPPIREQQALSYGLHISRTKNLPLSIDIRPNRGVALDEAFTTYLEGHFERIENLTIATTTTKTNVKCRTASRKALGALPNLRCLRIAGVGGNPFMWCVWPNLETLEVKHEFASPEEYMCLFEALGKGCTKLKMVRIAFEGGEMVAAALADWCKADSQGSLDLPELQNLSLLNCPARIAFKFLNSLNASRLQDLEVTGSPNGRPREGAWENLTISLPSLRRLILSQYFRADQLITTISNTSPHLEDLDFRLPEGNSTILPYFHTPFTLPSLRILRSDVPTLGAIRTLVQNIGPTVAPILYLDKPKHFTPEVLWLIAATNLEYSWSEDVGTDLKTAFLWVGRW